MGLYVVQTQAEGLTASTAETIIGLRGVSNDALITEFGLSFNGTDASEAPCLWEFSRQSTDGTSSTALTEEKQDNDGFTATVTGHADYSAEPTEADVIRSGYLTPNGGLLIYTFPPGREYIMRADERFGLVVTPGSVITASCTAYIEWSE